MDIMELGAIGELVGGVAVVASLIYVGLQIRQSTRTETARAFQEIFSGFNAHNHEMFSSQNIDLVITGMNDVHSLSGGKRLRFDHFMIGYVNAIESTIFSKGAFLLGDVTLENWAYSLRTRFLPYQGVRDWWSEAKSLFAAETRVFVDNQIAATDRNSDLLGIKSAR